MLQRWHTPIFFFFLPLVGFEPPTSGVAAHCANHCATREPPHTHMWYGTMYTYVTCMNVRVPARDTISVFKMLCKQQYVSSLLNPVTFLGVGACVYDLGFIRQGMHSLGIDNLPKISNRGGHELPFCFFTRILAFGKRSKTATNDCKWSDFLVSPVMVTDVLLARNYPWLSEVCPGTEEVP